MKIFGIGAHKLHQLQYVMQSERVYLAIHWINSKHNLCRRILSLPVVQHYEIYIYISDMERIKSKNNNNDYY